MSAQHQKRGLFGRSLLPVSRLPRNSTRNRTLRHGVIAIQPEPAATRPGDQASGPACDSIAGLSFSEVVHIIGVGSLRPWRSLAARADAHVVDQTMMVMRIGCEACPLPFAWRSPGVLKRFKLDPLQ
jgi:hypothetical protein